MQKVIVVIGAYGSGKSEYAINLANRYRKKLDKVILVDLDVVNPYFRSRDVREKFADDGIEVIAPDGEFKHADLPMLSPRIMGAVQNNDTLVILDVGGDPAGCRTLARYVPTIQKRGYEMHFVINTKRPFTNSALEIERMKEQLEGVSRLQITELICNTNLMSETTPEIIENGIKEIHKIEKKFNLPFRNFLVLQPNKNSIPDEIAGKKRIVLDYFLNKPWEMPIFKGI